MKKNKIHITTILCFLLTINVYAFLPNENSTMLSEDRQSILKLNANREVIDTLFTTNSFADIDSQVINYYLFSPNGRLILFSTTTEKQIDSSFYSNYYVFFLQENRLEILSENGKQQVPKFSPNSRMVAFVRNNNIYIRRIDFGTEIAVTNDGDSIFNGIPCPTYRRIFDVDRVFAWSPDSRLLAYVRLEVSDVRPIASVKVFDVLHMTTREMNILNPEEIFIPRILWGENSDSFGIITLNRRKTQMNFILANPRSTVTNSIIREVNLNGINLKNIHNIAFLPRNQIIFASERSGHNHLYLYSPVGILRQPITSGNWDVVRFLGHDPRGRLFFYQSTEINSQEIHTYSISTSGRRTRIN